MRYEKVQINWKPLELDYFLQRNYSYSLWHFSLSLAGNFMFWKDLRGYKKTESGYLEISWKDYWMKRIKELDDLKKKNIDTLDNFLKKVQPYLNNWEIPRALLGKKVSPGDRNYTEEMFELNPFFGQIDFLIKKMNGFLNIQKLRGAPYKRINILLLIWSFFIRDNKGNTHILNILRLLKWFDERFKGISLYRSFSKEIGEIHEEKVSKLVHRYRKQMRSDHLENIIKNGKIAFNESVQRKLFKVISFGNKNVVVKAMREFDLDKNSKKNPLIIFPRGERLTLEDFENNLKKSSLNEKNQLNNTLRGNS